MEHPSIDAQITFLYTHDLANSAAFYENILGLPLSRDQGTCRIYALTSSSYLGICQIGEGAKGTMNPGQQTNIIVTIVTHDVDQWFTVLQSRGVTFEKAPETNPRYNIYHCFLRDPNGYLIEIQRFLD
ncbi:MAG: VOC family protein [Anaerolineae bacterium]